jgi:rhamnogalacturonan I rhamnosyltransferase
VVLGGGAGAGARRRRAWRWAMQAVASAVVWTAVVQLASITGLFRPRVLADCGGGSGGGGAAAGLAALVGEDSVAARLSPPVLVPKSECFYSLLGFLLSGDLGELGTV